MPSVPIFLYNFANEILALVLSFPPIVAGFLLLLHAIVFWAGIVYIISMILKYRGKKKKEKTLNISLDHELKTGLNLTYMKPWPGQLPFSIRDILYESSTHNLTWDQFYILQEISKEKGLSIEQLQKCIRESEKNMSDINSCIGRMQMLSSAKESTMDKEE